MRISINEEIHEIKDKSSLAETLQHLNIPEIGVAVAVNSAVVPKDQWPACFLKEGDSLMLIRAAQGG